MPVHSGRERCYLVFTLLMPQTAQDEVRGLNGSESRHHKAFRRSWGEACETGKARQGAIGEILPYLGIAGFLPEQDIDPAAPPEGRPGTQAGEWWRGPSDHGAQWQICGAPVS